MAPSVSLKTSIFYGTINTAAYTILLKTFTTLPFHSALMLGGTAELIAYPLLKLSARLILRADDDLLNPSKRHAFMISMIACEILSVLASNALLCYWNLSHLAPKHTILLYAGAVPIVNIAALIGKKLGYNF